MKSISTASAILFLAFVGLLAGCASSARITSGDSALVPAAAPRAVVLETVSDVPDAELQRRIFHSMVISSLQRSPKVNKAASHDSPNLPAEGVKITARMKGLYKVSDGARVMFGGLAGRAAMTVEVTLADLVTGEQFGSFTAQGKSSGGWVGAGTTDQAVQKVADEVASEILKRL